MLTVNWSSTVVDRIWSEAVGYTNAVMCWRTRGCDIGLYVSILFTLSASTRIMFRAENINGPTGTTYPLDLVRSRLSIATASIPMQAAPVSSSSSAMQPALASGYHTASASAAARTAASSVFSPQDLTMWGMTLRVMREEGGFWALYRGLIPTAMGVAPYVGKSIMPLKMPSFPRSDLPNLGINFASYELLRGIITPPGKSGVHRKLLCGALAGSISQTLTYPFDVLRRKMQVTGMGALGYKYNGALDALQSILRTEGIRGLYRGLWPNLCE